MTGEEPKEWIVMQCIDAYRNAQGEPGEHKQPVPGLDTPMTRSEALQALKDIEERRPGDDFSIRRVAPVVPIDRT